MENESRSEDDSNGEFRFSYMLDKMLEGIQVIGFDWRYIYVNETLIKQSGYRRQELQGHTVMEIYPGIETTDVFQVLRKSMEIRSIEQLETEFGFPGKTAAWFELRIQPIPEGIFIFSLDITARKHAEEGLKAGEQEYRSLIDQATDAIFISDQSGNYTDVNSRACTMLGYSREELLRMNLKELLGKGDIENQPVRFEELRAGKTILSTRNLIDKRGSMVPVEINAKMLSNGRMLGIVRDISERMEAEEKLRASEDKFRNLTETAFDAIILIDETGNIKFWNRGAELMFGYSKEEVMDKTLTLIMPDKYRNAHDQGLRRYLQTGERRVIGKVISLEGQRKSGDIFPIELSITSWESSGRKMFSGIIRDDSERKETQDKILRLNNELEQNVIERTTQLEKKVRQLKESEEKFQKAFASSAAGITITRLADSTYLDVNDAFVTLTGYDRDELIGHTSAELKIVVDMPHRERVLSQIRERGSVKSFEMTIRNKSGRLLEILSSVETIVLNGEKYAINVIYDITERKRAEEQLESVNQELEAFSYSVSHDLRAPLRSILGYTAILKEDFSDKINDEGRRTLDIIQRNANKMDRLINDLLKFAKLGKKQLDKSEVQTHVLVQGIARIIGSEFENTRFIIRDLPDVFADVELLEQVWVNLLSNAAKYSAKKESPVVDVGAYESDEETIFYIKDNGAGFDSRYVDKLFIVFQRLHKTQEFEGTGVGLSIVKRIITKHGGRVWAEAVLNEGATFYFSIPSHQFNDLDAG